MSLGVLTITENAHKVAVLLWIIHPKLIDWPDFMKRSKSILGGGEGKYPGELIIKIDFPY